MEHKYKLIGKPVPKKDAGRLLLGKPEIGRAHV